MKVNKYIDYTNLKANSSKEDIKKLCKEAIENDFFSVCVNPCWISFVKEQLKNTDVKICTVIGFPLGANTIETKVFETENAIKKGVDEIDVVINIGQFLSGNKEYVKNELQQIVKIKNNKIVKVIVETCFLNNEQIIYLTNLCSNLKVNYIKTSTGFGTNGATLEDIKLMKENCKNYLKIKASGGIKDYNTTVKMIEKGADRIGTSKIIRKEI